MSFFTPWFPPSVRPVRDGVYITSQAMFTKDCWHAMRWNGATASWYGAGTTDNDQMNVIGWDRPNAHLYAWRGLAEQP